MAKRVIKICARADVKIDIKRMIPSKGNKMSDGFLSYFLHTF